jgi:biopolymer transport protein ExbD
MTGIHRQRNSPIVDINMIPLIDVSLVLLIIFMVMTPFLVQQQIRVNLPHSVTSSEAPDRPIVIVIQPQGELTLNGKAEAAASLQSDLKPLLRGKTDRPILVQADKSTPLEKVVAVMDIAKQLNVARLGISVETPQGKGQK